MRRLRRLAIVPSALLALSACGESEPAAETTGSRPNPTTEPTTTVPVTTGPETSSPPTGGSAYDHPTGAAEALISIGYEGGLAAPDVFNRVVSLIVAGDGRVISTGPVPAIYPGPLLPNFVERTISDEGIQTLLAEAQELGLLADVEYAGQPDVFDAPTTVVEITVDDRTYTHAAYALGFDEETDPDRAALAEFVAAASDLPATLGDSELGPERSMSADSYLFRARPVEPGTATTDVAPTFVDWPAAAPVRLADARECAVLPPDFGDALFADATQLTFFAEDGTTYQVTATARVPGLTC